jgi:low temperature requirement protein LtrA
MGIRSILKPPKLISKSNVSGRHATWLELFYDLVFVVAIAQITHDLSHHLTSMNMGKSIGLFLPVWWIWAGHTVYATRFDTDDVVYRMFTFIQMFCVAVIGVQLHQFTHEAANGYALAYIVARTGLLLMLARAHWHISDTRNATKLYLIGFTFGVFFWIASLFVDGYAKYLLWSIGLAVDFITPWIGWWHGFLKKIPVDASHVPERFGLLNIIVLGETVVAVVAGVSEVEWSMRVLLVALLGFGVAVSIWWMYFSYLEDVLGKMDLGSGQPYIYSHLPFIIGIAATGIGIEHVIISAEHGELTRNALWTLTAGAIIWTISFYAIKKVSIPQICTHRFNGRFFIAVLGFTGIGIAGLWLSGLVIQILITGIFTFLLISETTDGNTRTSEAN